MNRFLSVRPLLSLAVLWIGGLLTPAVAVEADLARITPVPADQPIPAVDFLRPAILREPALNPSGTRVAALIGGASGTFRLLVKDLPEGEPRFYGGTNDVTVYSLHWLDDHHIAFNLASTQGFDLGLLVAKVDSDAEAYPIHQYGSAQLIGVPKDTPLKPLVWLSGDAVGRPAGVVELDATLDTGGFVDMRGDEAAVEAATLEVARRNEQSILRVVPVPEGVDVVGYLADRDGVVEFAFVRGEDGLRALIWDENTWKPTAVDPSRFGVVAVGDQPGELLALLPATDGQPTSLNFINSVTGEIGDVVLRDAAYDFSGTVYRDPGSRAIVGAMYDRDGPTTTWFDPGYRDLQRVLNGYFPGKVVRLVDGNTEGTVFIVQVSSDRDPITFYTLDLKARTVGRLQSERPWLDPERLQAMSMLKFRTADDKRLDAYVTLPAGTTKENPAPLVVLPHGGPWSRNSWGFNGEVQFLVSRGFAVLQPNYRGSVGYDWMFTQADRTDMLAMQDDVRRALRTVLRTGLIDANRVALVGGGFGAYLALGALEQDPDLYRCAVVHSGIYDWAEAANDLGEARDLHPSYGALFQRLGAPGTESARYEAVSPARRLERVRDPVLVVSNDDPEGLERRQADALVAGLIRGGTEYERYVLEGESGSLASQVALFNRIEAFLKANL